MGYVVKMPKLGLEMEQGTVLEWYVREGDAIEEGDVLLEVESEKSIGEVEARESGVLRLLALSEGETVSPGTPIGIVAGEGEDIADLEAEFESEADSGGENEESAMTETDAASDGESGTARSTAGDGETSGVGKSADVKASPRAKKRAEEVGVALATVDGSGPGGAVTADDVEAAADGVPTGTGTESTASTGTGTTAEQVRASPRAKDRASELDVDLTTVDGTGPRNAITAGDVDRAATADESGSDDRAANDLASGDRGTTGGVGAGAAVPAPGRYQRATLVTDAEDGTADALIEATALAREAFDLDVSALDVVLVAVSAALTEHPVLNATLEDNTHHVHEHQHVALDAGESHPNAIVTNVAERSFADRVATREGEAESARTGDEHEQVTFALGVGGNLKGSLEPPTVAGLTVDASRRRATPAANGDGVSLGRYLSCVLSYDPRAVGDGSARQFLESVCASIERAPELLLRTYR